MSIAEPRIIATRIKAACPTSRIAVFKADLAGSLNAVFADTCASQVQIKEDADNLIGIYDGSENLTTVLQELQACAFMAPAQA